MGVYLPKHQLRWILDDNSGTFLSIKNIRCDPQWNHLEETVLMMGQNVCFKWINVDSYP